MAPSSYDPVRGRQSYRSALVSCGLNAFGSPLELWVGKDIPDLPWWPPLLSSALSLLLAALLYARRRDPNVHFASSVFLANNVSIISFLWITNAAFTTSSTPWVPYQANKLGMLAVSVLGPELIPGLLTILAFGGTALLHAHLHNVPSTTEPAVVTVYAMFAVVLLIYRRRGLALERRLAHAQAASESSNKLAHSFLVIRDLANTPLQTIELTAELLQKRYPDAEDLTERMNRSVLRLRKLRETFILREEAAETLARTGKSTETSEAFDE